MKSKLTTSIGWASSSAVLLSRQWIKWPRGGGGTANGRGWCHTVSRSATVCCTITQLTATHWAEVVQQLIDTIAHLLQLTSQILWFLTGQLSRLVVDCVYSQNSHQHFKSKSDCRPRSKPQMTMTKHWRLQNFVRSFWGTKRKLWSNWQKVSFNSGAEKKTSDGWWQFNEWDGEPVHERRDEANGNWWQTEATNSTERVMHSRKMVI